MKSIRVQLSLTLGLMLVGLLLQAWYWAQLPERVAIHFGADGNPNDWLGKTGATILSSGLLVGIPLFFAMIPMVVQRLPTAMINIPNREYWFAPERREESLKALSSFMAWFNVAITTFVVCINHITFVANRDAQPLAMGLFGTALVAFLLTTFVGVGFMIRRFSRPAFPKAQQTI